MFWFAGVFMLVTRQRGLRHDKALRLGGRSFWVFFCKHPLVKIIENKIVVKKISLIMWELKPKDKWFSKIATLVKGEPRVQSEVFHCYYLHPSFLPSDKPPYTCWYLPLK